MERVRSFLQRNLAFVFLLVLALVGGGLSVLVKIALLEIPPLTFSSLRFLLAIIILLPFFLREKIKLNRDILRILGLSLFGAGNIALFALGIRYTSANTGQIIYVASPILAGVLSAIILKEQITKNKVIGVLLGLLGTSLIIFLPIIDKNSPISGTLLGNSIITLAMISFTIFSVYSKHFQKKYSPVYITFFFMLTTFLVTLSLSLVEFKTHPSWWLNVTHSSLLSLLYVGILGTAGYYLIYQYAIKVGSPLIASMTLYLQPITTFIWAYILLGEKLNIGFVLGAIFSLFGAWFATRSRN